MADASYTSGEPIGLVYRDDEWEHGLRCAECNRLMQEGDRYSERLHALTSDGIPIVVIVCVGCAVMEAAQ